MECENENGKENFTFLQSCSQNSLKIFSAYVFGTNPVYLNQHDSLVCQPKVQFECKHPSLINRPSLNTKIVKLISTPAVEFLKRCLL